MENKIEETSSMDIIQRVTNFNGDVEAFVKDMKAFADQMKRQSKAYAIIDTLKYMHGEYVWVLSPRLVHTNTNMFNFEQLYLGARAKFNPDGTDNRLELTAENQLSTEIQQSSIIAIQYGSPFGSLWNNDNEKNKKWWYRTSSYSQDQWFDEELISSVSREDLIRRWRKKFDDIRDAYFENHYKGIEQERQRKIADAKRILEQEGIKP